ncbi:fe2+ zn2+ uptake regulation protein [Pseudomonas sp. NPDC087697]|uniref:fe2+ zn2+ uptake regulation protein n=1 Tax=Pseudomonas sp. NPDC087697 TaxID=3364447 RepID=UPI00380E5595
MYHRSASQEALAPQQLQSSSTHRPFDCDSNNEHIREMLYRYGLRTSLLRFKIINILCAAAVNGTTVNAKSVHDQLRALALSLVSVRDALKRLCSVGVITRNHDKSYSLTSGAKAILEQRCSGRHFE